MVAGVSLGHFLPIVPHVKTSKKKFLLPLTYFWIGVIVCLLTYYNGKTDLGRKAKCTSQARVRVEAWTRILDRYSRFFHTSLSSLFHSHLTIHLYD